jgi:hypothetical protein
MHGIVNSLDLRHLIKTLRAGLEFATPRLPCLKATMLGHGHRTTVRTSGPLWGVPRPIDCPFG